jgi:hypothetical protein
MVFYYTNERTFTDIMEARFGKSREEKINFSAGTTGTKKMLKDDDLSILNHVEISSDQEVFGYIIRLILLNIGMCVGIPAIVIPRVEYKLTKKGQELIESITDLLEWMRK